MTVPQFVVLLALSLMPPAVLLGAGWTSWQWILLGAGAWVTAVVVKAVAGAVLWWAIEKVGGSARAKAAFWGVWSAVCELGVAAAFFLEASEFPSLLDSIGFGVGAGSIEALMVVCAGAVSARRTAEEPEAEGDDETASADWILAWGGVVERALASTGHVASRGVVWVGIQSWGLSPFVLAACATFAVVDGVATYGSDVEWDWTDADRLRWFYGLVAKVTALEVAAFVLAVVALRTLTG